MDESIDFTRRIIPSTKTDFVVYSTTASPVLLAHFDGPNNSQTFIDAVGRHSFIPSGTQIVLSTTQFKFAPSSLSSNAVDLLKIGDALDDFQFGTGDFTIDYWVWMNDFTTNNVVWETRDASSQAYLFYNSGGVGRHFEVYNGTSNIIVGSLTASATTWYHIALVRSSGILRQFVNGNLDGQVADARNIGVPTFNTPNIGGDRNFVGQRINGFIDEFRVVKGYAVWTSPFTPPSTPYLPP